MGLGAIDAFAVTWVVMMAAMMLPSAIPVVLEFARTAEGRRGWPFATGVLAVTYLGVWLMFGVVSRTRLRKRSGVSDCSESP